MFKRNNGFGGKSFGKKDFSEKTMHKTSCNKCGNTCEVPFKPNGKKPVFCNDCFVKDDSRSDRSDRFEKPSYRSSERSYDRPERSFGDKPSYPATCGDCGTRCTVPFKPMQGKPVLCRECFSGEGKSSSHNASGMTSEQFEILNKKMDAILKAVGAYVSTPKRLSEKKPLKEVEEEDSSESEDKTEEEAPKPKKAWAKIKYD